MPNPPSHKPASIEVEIRVRYTECDPMNVAHHSAFVVWLEIARTELLRTSGISYRELEAQGVYFAVARLSVSYKRPALYDDVVTVLARTAAASRVKIDHEYEVRREGELIATATSTLACIDRDGKVRQIPPGIVS